MLVIEPKQKRTQSQSADRKQISFTDGFRAGTFKLWASRDLEWYSEKEISRIRIIRRADDYGCQFLIDWHSREKHKLQGNVVGIDLGLKELDTDSNGNTVENSRYLRKSQQLKVLAEYKYSTGGHLETDPTKVNALMSFDLWLVGENTNRLSRLAELRISGCAEKPPLYSQN